MAWRCRKSSSVWAMTSTIALPRPSTSKRRSDTRFPSRKCVRQALSHPRPGASRKRTARWSLSCRHPGFGSCRTIGTAQPDIERAGAAMPRIGFLETDDDAAEFRRRKPLRNRAVKNAARSSGPRIQIIRTNPLPVTTSTILRVAALRRCEKAAQSKMRFVLAQPVQVEHVVDARPVRARVSCAAADRRGASAGTAARQFGGGV